MGRAFSESDTISSLDPTVPPQVDAANMLDPYHLSLGIQNGHNPNDYLSYDMFTGLDINERGPYSSNSPNVQDYNYAYGADFLPDEYSNLPPPTYSIHELRTQLEALARQLGFPTVESSTAAWNTAVFKDCPNLFVMYFTVLATFVAKGGLVNYLKLPLSSPEASTTPNSSSEVPRSPNSRKRRRDESEGFERGVQTAVASRKPIAGERIDSEPSQIPSISVDAMRNPLSLAGSPSFASRRLQNRDVVFISHGSDRSSSARRLDSGANTPNTSDSISLTGSPSFASKNSIRFGDAVSISYSPEKPLTGSREYTCHSLHSVNAESEPNLIIPSRPLALINPSNTLTPSIQHTPSNLSTSSLQSTSTNPAGHVPQLLSRCIYFISTRLDQGIRIRIQPDTMEAIPETWIDIPGVWFLPFAERKPAGTDIIGYSAWLFMWDMWMPSFYHQMLIEESMLRFQMGQGAEFHSKILDKVPAHNPTFDPECNPKPEHNEISYPTGDDLGVDWFASRDENSRVRFARRVRRSLDRENREAERDNTWLWYLWKRHGLARGWVEQPKEFGNRMRNKRDNELYIEMMQKTQRGLPCTLAVGFKDMKKTLDGESIQFFREMWEFRHRNCGGPSWGV